MWYKEQTVICMKSHKKRVLVQSDLGSAFPFLSKKRLITRKNDKNIK